MKTPVALLMLATGVFFCAQNVYAQNTTAEIAGAVTGQDRFPLAGASLIITQASSGLERKVATDARRTGQLPRRNAQQLGSARRRTRPRRAQAAAL